jgi:hypothetical protein
MLSLYLRKDKSENSSVEILRRTTGMYILGLPMLKLKTTRWDKTLKIGTNETI